MNMAVTLATIGRKIIAFTLLTRLAYTKRRGVSLQGFKEGIAHNFKTGRKNHSGD